MVDTYSSQITDIRAVITSIKKQLDASRKMELDRYGEAMVTHAGSRLARALEDLQRLDRDLSKFIIDQQPAQVEVTS